ncbi:MULTISPECIES: hypothetical protein [Ruminobacter]|jgi:FtsZ-binding cell division protein ZapB|uniref:Cell division protein ZapB n=1 Tax=Ruminobacter amylophilus TaxID=867 RepID=A0A662ZHW2_9GAMM|nr:MULTISPECIES: hypothetical protein [Ruminobacter]SFP46723.1 hypothetical protein SAMN02910344_01464 [Ruminobacter amylophilus]
MSDFSQQNDLIQRLDNLKDKISQYQEICNNKLREKENQLVTAQNEIAKLSKENSTLKENLGSWQKRIASSIGMIRPDK